MAERSYRVEARRDGGQGWIVKVDGLEGTSGFAIRDLSELERKARRHIFGYTDRLLDEIDLHIDVVLPPEIEQRLEVAEQLITDIGVELKQAGAELYNAGCVPADVWWLFTHRQLGLQIASLTIANSELAEHGLSKHPKVTGVRWSDHGFAETVKCWACVEATRDEYVGLDEAGTNELLYDAVTCDFCEAGHDD